MATRVRQASYPATGAARAQAPRRPLRYSTQQRLAFVASLLVLGAASFYAGLGMLTRAYPAVFPGENAPFSTVLQTLPGPVRVEQPGEDSVFNKRRNFLVVGVDRRSDEPIDGEFRTDAIMVASVDPISKSISLVNFPRDLYVEQTDGAGSVVGQARINQSWGAGVERDGGVEGGARQLIADMEHNFGIEIDQWAMLDFMGVETLIDAVGGIDIDIPADLAVYDWYYSDESGRRPPEWVSFPPGEQHLDGYHAVAFGRNREPTDIERGKRQQLVIQTAMQKAISKGMLQNPVETYNAFSDTVRHNIGVGMAPGLASLVLDARGELTTYSLGDPVNGVETVTDWVTPSGGQVLLWDRQNVQYWLEQAFSRSSYARSDVMIKNGSGTGGNERVEQLGRYLRFAKGLPTVYQGPATELQATTRIIVQMEERRDMARQIAEWMELPESAIVMNETDDPDDAEIVIVIGEDFELPGD